MPEFISTPLYGGAIVCDLPDNFADVRLVRLSLSPHVEVVC
jgi:hypothetical protein